MVPPRLILHRRPRRIRRRSATSIQQRPDRQPAALHISIGPHIHNARDPRPSRGQGHRLRVRQHDGRPAQGRRQDVAQDRVRHGRRGQEPHEHHLQREGRGDGQDGHGLRLEGRQCHHWDELHGERDRGLRYGQCAGHGGLYGDQ